jgi:hypothetical protein
LYFYFVPLEKIDLAIVVILIKTKVFFINFI